MSYTNSDYTTGKDNESKVIQWLTNKGFTVRPSTQHEDWHLDIDCYVNGVPTSIKSQHTGFTRKNIGFEIEVFSKYDQAWVNSWWINGQAEQYLFYRGAELRFYQKKALKTYVRRYGFAYTRELSPVRQASQVAMNHPHTNSRVGYLYQNCVPSKLLGYIND